MPVARNGMTAAVIGERLYVVGGHGVSSFLNLNSAYDPATDSWLEKAPASLGRAWSATNSVAIDGVVYAVAGNPPGFCTTAMEGYNSGTNVWSFGPSAPRERCHAASVALGGRMYVLGGWNTSSTIHYVEIDVFDPVSNTWSTPATLRAARGAFGAAALGGELFILGGGVSPSFLPSNSVEAYNPATNTWRSVAPMLAARSVFAVAVLNGRLYAIGGLGADNTTHLNTVESYDPTSNTWRAEPPMTTARAYLSAGVLNGVLYAVGGSNNAGVLATNEAFTPATPDVEPPTLTLPPSFTVNATSPSGAIVSFTASATDNSGSATVSCNPPSGSIFAIGVTTTTCSATDASGNRTAGSFTVTVLGAPEQIANLIEFIAGMPISPTLRTQLVSSLKTALAYPNSRKVACPALSLFISAVRAKSGTLIPVVKAQQIIADATRIKAVIGCP
jgi:N-acetylneuraminic acid mutarotase